MPPCGWRWYLWPYLNLSVYHSAVSSLGQYLKLIITWFISDNFTQYTDCPTPSFQKDEYDFHTLPFPPGVAGSDSLRFDPNFSSLRYLFDLFYLCVYLLTVLRISLHWKLPWRVSYQSDVSVVAIAAAGLQCILNGVFTVPYYITVLNIIMNQSGASQITHFNHVFLSLFSVFATFFFLAFLYFLNWSKWLIWDAPLAMCLISGCSKYLQSLGLKDIFIIICKLLKG